VRKGKGCELAGGGTKGQKRKIIVSQNSNKISHASEARGQTLRGPKKYVRNLTHQKGKSRNIKKSKPKKFFLSKGTRLDAVNKTDSTEKIYAPGVQGAICGKYAASSREGDNNGAGDAIPEPKPAPREKGFHAKQSHHAVLKQERESQNEERSETTPRKKRTRKTDQGNGLREIRLHLLPSQKDRCQRRTDKTALAATKEKNSRENHRKQTQQTGPSSRRKAMPRPHQGKLNE